MLDAAVHIGRVLRMMGPVCPHVANDISQYLDDNLAAYAANFYHGGKRWAGKLSREYRDKLIGKFVQRVRVFSISVDEDEVTASINRFPMIQTSPHCQLYIEPMVFWAYLMGWMGAARSGVQYLPVFNTATVTLQSRASSGPAWLPLASGSTNITNLVSSKLASISVFTAPQSTRYVREKCFRALDRASPTEKIGIERLSSSLTSEPDDFAEQTDQTNVRFLKSLSHKNISPILFHEGLIIELLIELLEAPDSLVNKLLFEAERHARLMQAFADGADKPYTHFLSHTTCHFWGVREHKIRKLRLEKGYLTEADKAFGAGFMVRFAKEAILDGLRQGLLLPNLFWCFVLVVILPMLAAIGGTRQIGYLEGFIDIFCNALDASDADEAELVESLRSSRLSYWGAKVIECMPAPITVIGELPEGVELDTLLDMFSRISLQEASMHLQAFFQHQRWQHLY